MTLKVQEYKNKILLMKNAKLLSREAQKSINGGASRIICCEYNDNGKCILWIGPGQNCP
ncbi:hypothetical protein BCF50_3437 [Chryseobacterium daecheongense]|uniref:Bacteriocin n=1 Tax=Chryseobacterium daecheongense TaxID=192389 RepID=A0ABY2FRN6_9FLAO|nr:hypothetical protein BCF50_3437 [Chryseobacterium daecheongense]